MKLTKDFLTTALPQAAVYQNGSLLQPTDEAAWQALADRGDIMVSIDSRTIQPGEFFVALKGPSFDGHDFIRGAVERGAIGVLMGRDRLAAMTSLPADLQRALFVVVDDTLAAFVALAKVRRQQFTGPVVAITGSVGKTSTREMLRTILATAGVPAYTSIKTYNNVFGVSYSLLCIPSTAKVAVLEVGISEKGEMAQLVDIVRPSIGIITNVAHAHLEGLGNSLACVAYEKRQLFSHFTTANVGIVCGDQAILNTVSYSHPVARFGLKTKNQVQARKVAVINDEDGGYKTSFTLKWYGHKASVVLATSHTAMVMNALAAATAAYFLSVSFEAVVDGLQAYRGFERRFEMKKIRGNRGILLNDCYNANPESMKAALTAFGKLETTGPKIAVIGDMLELGAREAYWHRQIGRFIGKNSALNSLILVGERTKGIAKTLPRTVTAHWVKDWQEARVALEGLLTASEAAVLVKASRGVHLDLMVKEIVE
jgi:UDP-N-acetylmuramoyl-tripeptide--D-alanyl-D-alanine ligase